MLQELDFENLRLCLNYYKPTRLHIMDFRVVKENGKFRSRGRTIVSEDLTDKILDFKKNGPGLYMLVDSNEVFHFPLEDYPKGFSVAYERIESTKASIERAVGIDPNDPDQPKIRQSLLRIMLDKHEMNIVFNGKLYLKSYSEGSKSLLKYWTIDKPGNIQEDT